MPKAFLARSLFLLCLIIQSAASVGRAETPVPTIRKQFGSLVESGRLKIEKVEALKTPRGAGVRVIGAFEFKNPKGVTEVARGKFLLPPALARGEASGLPLVYFAGYELDEARGADMAGRGFAVVTPMSTPLNPISRTPSLDVALLHIARALPYVDDAKVMVWGASGGGYTTLMLAAETFPLAGALPEVPPVNLGYNVEYFYNNKQRVLGTLADPKLGMPNLATVILGLTDQVCTYLPQDRNAPAWFDHSPLAHLEQITAPVTVTFSTGDALVPIHQVDRGRVQLHAPSLFPEGYVVAPEAIVKSKEGLRTLLEMLPKERYTLLPLSLPPGTPLTSGPSDNPGRFALIPIPFDGQRAWDIVIVDEGPIRPKAWHYAHHFGLVPFGVMSERMKRPIAPDQLTPVKLEQLMDRYAGSEWISPSLPHLDAPAMERADVLRGLLTYVKCGEAHAARFVELYRQLPAGKQPLGRAILETPAPTPTQWLESLRR